MDDVKEFLSRKPLDDIQEMVEDIPAVKAEKIRRTTDLEFAEDYLDLQKRRGVNRDNDMSLNEPTKQEGFRPTYENFLPKYSEPFRAAMWKSQYGSDDAKDNIESQLSPDDIEDTQPLLDSDSTTTTATTRRSSNTANPTAFHNENNASFHQPSMPTQGKNFPSSTSASTAQPHAHMNQTHQGLILPSGLCLRPTPRQTHFQDYDNDRVVVSKNSRGSTDKERAKIREMCVKPITPLLDNSNVKKLLSTDPGSDNVYDIAEDASSWQDGIDNIYRHAVSFDFKVIFLIPNYFDPGYANSIPVNATFTNSILDHTKVAEIDCYKWQEYINRHGQHEDWTSDHWMEEKLWRSLSTTLLKEVKSDFKRLPKLQQGAVSLVRIIINRMVQDSQDSRRALEEYIKSFSICNFPGEDVTMACRAVANALGRDRLPSDIVQRVLDGFSHAFTPAFQHLCHTQVAMMSSSLIRNAIRSDPLYTQLDNIMHDLEVRFMELRSGQNWLGIGHGTTNTSVFTARHDDSSDSDEDEDVSHTTGDNTQYQCYKASFGSKALPFEEWVRDKTCRHCGEKGHIQGEQCPTYVRDVFAGRVPLPRPKHCSARGGRNASRLPHNRPSKTDKPYKKFFQAMMSALDGHDDDNTTNPTPALNDEPLTVPPTSKHEHSGFLAALGCPKE